MAAKISASGLGSTVSSSRNSLPRRRGPSRAAIARAICEVCEPRFLLTAALDAKIPTLIAGNGATQTLLAPGTNSYSMTSNSTTTAVSSSYRFVLNSATAGQTITLATSGSNIARPDAAIALYDASGNRIALQDADTGGNDQVEVLTQSLQSGQQYTVAFYAIETTSSGSDSISMQIILPAQANADTLNLNPATGSGTLTTSSVPDAFTSGTNVRYFPVNLIDAGQSGTITITPTSPDSSVRASLFELISGTYTQISSGTLAAGATSVSLAVTPPTNLDITDGSYLLEIAPLNFTAAAEPVTITVNSTPILPASILVSNSHYGISESLSSAGTLTGSVSGSFNSSSGTIASMIASVTGPMTVTMQPTTYYGPVLGVYGPGGTPLMAVASSLTPGTSATLTFNAVAGTSYYFYAGPEAASSGSFTLTTTQSYTPTPVAVTSTMGTIASIALSPSSGVQTFQLTAPAGSNYVALQLAPDSGQSLQVQIQVTAPNQGVTTYTATGLGQPLIVVLDESQLIGPYDVVLSGIAGTGATATFKYVSLTVPTSIALNQFSTSYLNLSSGKLTSASLPVTTGVPTGIKYYQPATNANLSLSTYTANSSGGATAVILHYVQNGNVFQLAEAAAPSVSGIASVNDITRGQALHALVALPVNFSGAGTVVLSSSNPLAKGTSLAEVPNALPGHQMSNYSSTVSVTAATITMSSQLDLYSVQLPFNMTDTSSTLQFTPIDVGGPLHATVSVLNSSNGVIASATNTAGQPLSIPVTGLSAGQTIRFLVQPVPGSNVGNGQYTFSMADNTTNPLPYLVTEPVFSTYVPPAQQLVQAAYLPNVAPTVITFGSTGGSASGSFTSSVPYANNGTGSIQVFEITGFTVNTPFTVYTTDNNSNIDTNFALYEPATYNSSGGAVTYTPVAGTGPSFDYYPGDRTQVDAKIVVNNYILDPTVFGGEFPQSVVIYAVVMNEQGSQGGYTITTAPVTPITTGPGVVTSTPVLPVAPVGDTPYIAPAVETTNGSVFDVRGPSDLGTGSSSLVVKTLDGSTGQTITVRVAKFNAITGPSIYTGTVGTGGTVTIPIGIAHNTSYTVTVSASTLPSLGMDLWLGIPLATATGPMPAALTTTNVPQSAAYNSGLTRLDPGPDGSISTSYNVAGGTFRTIFNVQNAGQVTLSTFFPSGSTSVDVGLYQSGQQGGTNNNGPYTSDGVLIDYSNIADGNGNYNLNDYLEPGTYFLAGAGTVPTTGTRTATITGTSPAVLATVVSVEPSTGMTYDSEDSVVNPNGAESSTPVYDFPFSMYRFGTSFFQTTVPSNTNGQPISVELFDNPTNASPSHVGVGTATLTLWRYLNGVYTNVGTATNALNDNTASDIPLTSTDTPVAGAQYFIGVDLNGFATTYYVTVTVPINVTGKPDYSVSPLQLLPDYEQTLTQTTVVNGSFSAAPATTYTIKLGSVTVTRDVPALAPFGTFLISTPWTPLTPADTSQVIVNPLGLQVEQSAANDATALIALSTVDATAPSITIALADSAMTGESTAAASVGGGTWGRYISGVTGQTSTINFVGSDPDSDLYYVSAIGPYIGSARSFASSTTFSYLATGTVSVPIDFGKLNGTSSSNLNQIQFFAVDIYGLRTPTRIQTLDVATPPSFLTGGIPANGSSGAGGTITFNISNHTFSYAFQDSIISLSDTLSSLLGISVPVIGDYQNYFLVDISGKGTGGLNPTNSIPLALTGEAKLVALNDTLFDKSYSNYNASSNVSFTSAMTLDGKSLIPGSVSVNMTLKTLPIQSYTSPLIPIVSFGIPDIASVDAGLKFSVASNISGGATLGLDPTGVSGVEGYLGAIGIMSPTFIQPSIMGTASVTGQVDILGYDAADISGNVSLTLTLTLGLDNSVANAVIPISQAVHDLALTVDAKLTVGISSSLFGFNIFSYNYNKDFGNIVNTIQNGIYLTDPPKMGAGNFIGPSTPGAQANDDPAPVISTGSTLVGAYTVDPGPQIAINSSTGLGLAVQVANVGTANAPQGNLTVATRANSSSAWSTSTLLSENNDVTYPELALSHDGAQGTTPAVVVYNVDNVAGSPSTQTLNQRLDATDLSYRYYNGTAWGPELTLTSDNLYDSEQSLAFGSTGNGVLAYVHNTDAAPISSSGVYDSASEDIYASIWNKTSHTWGTPVAITSSDGVADGKPSTFVDSNGKDYVVWVRATALGSQIWYSTSTGGAWSTAAQLAISGLPTGGTFKNVAIGSDGSGRANVVFSYEITNADGSLTTALYQRPAAIAGFTGNLPAVQITSNANYSGLKVTNDANGDLIAYWEQSDGQLNQIFATTIISGVASTPVQVTDDPNVAMEPSAAVDTNGNLQVLYNNTIMYGGTSQGNPTDPSVGAPLAAGVASSSAAMLPQLTFTTGLAFPVESQAAPVGSTLTGTAVIANRGLAAATVTITAYDGLPTGGTVVGTPQTITLLAGASYNFSQLFTVLAGLQTYSLKLTTSSGQAFDTTENISSTTLTGAADLVATQLTTDNSASPGGTALLYAYIQNASTTAVGSFTVTFYSGDPLSPQYPLTVLGTQTVTSLAASSSTFVNFTVTLPAGAGDDIYTDVVDSGNAITESNENNNQARYEVIFQADPAIVDPGTGAVTATLLNANTSNNVQVVVNVENLGSVPMFNVPVDLNDSRNGGVSSLDGQMSIPELDPGATVVETFTVSALAGDNLFTGSIDSSVYGADSNLSNDNGQADLYVPGLPTIVAAATLSSGTTAVGAPLTLNANLSNAGIGDAVNVPLIVLAALTSGGASYQVGTATGSVSALGTTIVPISLNTSGLLPGTYTLTLEVDPNQTVLQGSETGNIATVSEVLVGGLTLTGPNEYLRLDADGVTLDIWNATTATGSPNSQVALSSIGLITAAAPSGSQNITVDFSKGDPLPSGGLTYIGPTGGNNILAVVGTTGNDTATVNATSVNFVSGSVTGVINYTGATSINFNGSTGSDTLVQSAQPSNGAGLIFVSPTLSDTLTINGGQFTFLAAPSGSGITPINIGAVNIGNGGVVAMSPPNGRANRSVLTVNTLAFTGTGKLDLASNDLIVHTTSLSAITSDIKTGFNAGSVPFSGNGITSSTAATDPTHLEAVGAILNNDGAGHVLYGSTAQLGQFDQQNPLLTDVLVKFTYFGDANLDGKVDGSDYSRIDSGYTNHLTGWFNGDFNYDGVIDGSDYTLIDNAFNSQGASLAAQIASPTSIIATKTDRSVTHATVIFSTSPISYTDSDNTRSRKYRRVIEDIGTSFPADIL